MANITEPEATGDGSCLQNWHDLQQHHTLLAAKRIDTEDGRRELDEDKADLDKCLEKIRKQCLTVQSRILHPSDVEELLQATHSFLKAQERLEPKQKRYNRDIADLIQLEGKATQYADRVFGEASPRTFEVIQEHVRSLPTYDPDDAIPDDREMTVTEDTDRHVEWEEANSPVTELLSRLNSIETQILPLGHPETAGSDSLDSLLPSVSDIRTKVSAKAVARRSQDAQQRLLGFCREWNEASMELHNFPLVKQLPEDDEVPLQPPEATSHQKEQLELKMLHHIEIPSLPKHLSIKAKALSGGLYCPAREAVKIDLEDIKRIKSSTTIDPEPLSELLNLRYEDEDVDRWHPGVVMHREALNRWLYDQLLGSEKHLGIYTSMLSQKPKIFNMKIGKLRELIRDTWQIDNTQMTRTSKSVQLETTQQRSRQAQPDLEHLSVNIEPVGEPLVLLGFQGSSVRP